jgi:hypothetical protein
MKSVQTLMNMPRAERDLTWLQDSLQAAIQVEPVLCSKPDRYRRTHI